MTFQLARRTRNVMLMVPACPESGFLDVLSQLLAEQHPAAGPAAAQPRRSRCSGSGRDRHL